MQNYDEARESIEARAIMRLVALDTTALEGARKLIAIPKRQEQVLRLLVAVSAKEGSSIGYAIAFRRKAMAEFERLVAEAHCNEFCRGFIAHRPEIGRNGSLRLAKRSWVWCRRVFRIKKPVRAG